MKKAQLLDVNFCDSCGKQENYVTKCISCGVEHCFDCRKTEGKTYSRTIYVSGRGDGYYCKKCDEELTKSRADKRHNAYRAVESLRHECDAWNLDFNRRRKVVESELESYRP